MENVMVDWQHIARALVNHWGRVGIAADRVGLGIKAMGQLKNGKSQRPMMHETREKMLIEYRMISGYFSDSPEYEPEFESDCVPQVHRWNKLLGVE